MPPGSRGRIIGPKERRREGSKHRQRGRVTEGRHQNMPNAATENLQDNLTLFSTGPDPVIFSDLSLIFER